MFLFEGFWLTPACACSASDPGLTGPVPVAELAALPALNSVYLSNNSFVEVEASFAALTSAIHQSGRKVEVDMLGRKEFYVGNEVKPPAAGISIP